MGRWRSRPVAGVLVAVALVAGCTVRPTPQPRPDSGAAVPSTAAVTRGTTLATRAFVVEVEPRRGGRVRAGPTDALPVTSRRTAEVVDTFTGATSVVLVFPLLRTRPSCLRQVELWLHLLSFDHEQANLAAYPSLLTPLATGGDIIANHHETLLDNRPKGIGLLTADGAWMHFDITELYRTWAAGGPFPSRSRTVDPRTPLVVDVRAEDFDHSTFTARVAPLGKDPDTAPQLRWSATPGC